MDPIKHNTIIFSKEEPVDRKRITRFLINNKIEFQPVKNIYQDYEASIRVYDISPEVKRIHFTGEASPESVGQGNQTNNATWPRNSKTNETKKRNKASFSRSNSPIESSSNNKSSNKPSKKQLERLVHAFENLMPNQTAHFSEFSSPDQSKESIMYNHSPSNPIDKKVKRISRKEEASKNGSKRGDSPNSHPKQLIEEIIAYSVNEIHLFLKVNKRVLRREPESKIQGYIKKLCIENLRGFNMNHQEKIFVMDSVLKEFDGLSFSQQSISKSKVLSNSKDLQNSQASQYLEDEDSYKSDGPTSSSNNKIVRDSSNNVRSSEYNDKYYNEHQYEHESEEDRRAHIKSQKNQKQHKDQKNTTSNFRADENYVHEEYETNNKSTPRLGPQQNPTVDIIKLSNGNLQKYGTTEKGPTSEKHLSKSRSRSDKIIEDQAQESRSEKQVERTVAKDVPMYRLIELGRSEGEVSGVETIKTGENSVVSYNRKGRSRNSIPDSLNKEESSGYERDSSYENADEKLRKSMQDSIMNQRMLMQDNLRRHFDNKVQNSSASSKKKARRNSSEDQSFDVEIIKGSRSETVSQKSQSKSGRNRQDEQSGSRRSSESPNRSRDLDVNQNKKKSRGSVNNANINEGGALKSWATKLSEDDSSNQNKKVKKPSFNSNGKRQSENQSIDYSVEEQANGHESDNSKHNSKGEVGGRRNTSFEKRPSKFKNEQQMNKRNSSSIVQTEFKSRPSNGQVRARKSNLNPRYEEDQAKKSDNFSFREGQSNEVSRDDEVGKGERSKSSSYSPSRNSVRSSKIYSRLSRNSSPLKETDLSSTEDTPSKLIINKAEDLLKKLRVDNQQTINNPQVSMIEASTPGDEEYPYLRGPSYRSPKRQEALRKLVDSEKIYQQKLIVLNSTFADRSSALLSTLNQSQRSHSPIVSPGFVYSKDVSQEKCDLIQKQKQTKDWYSEYARNALKNDINISEQKNKKIIQQGSKDDKSIKFEKMSSSDIIAFHKGLVKKSNLQTIENLRKSQMPKSLNNTSLRT